MHYVRCNVFQTCTFGGGAGRIVTRNIFLCRIYVRDFEAIESRVSRFSIINDIRFKIPLKLFRV